MIPNPQIIFDSKHGQIIQSDVVEVKHKSQDGYGSRYQFEKEMAEEIAALQADNRDLRETCHAYLDRIHKLQEQLQGPTT